MASHTVVQMFLVTVVMICLGTAQSHSSFLKRREHVSTDPPKFSVAERSAREACPYWNAIGVLDDHLELMCEGGKEFEFAFKPDGVESLAMACCPLPYKACELSERVAGCDAIIAPLFMVNKHPDTAEQALLLVQEVRGSLRDMDEKCHVLPAELPHVKCGGSPTGASFNRPDIFCEMMLWQSEQLGDGAEAEYKRNGCPWAGTATGKQERHQAALKQENIPSWSKIAKEVNLEPIVFSKPKVMDNYDPGR